MFYNCWCNVHLKCKIQNSTQSSKTTETTMTSMYVHNRVYFVLIIIIKSYISIWLQGTLVLPVQKCILIIL